MPYCNRPSPLSNSERFARTAAPPGSGQSTAAGGFPQARSFSSALPRETPQGVTQCRIWPSVFPLAGLPGQIYLERRSPKGNILLTSSSKRSTGLVVPGSHLSTEQPEFSPLFPQNLPTSSGRGRCRRAGYDSSSDWLAVLVTGNPANSAQQDKPRAGEVGGREASLTLCFSNPRQISAALKPVTLLNECYRKKTTECFTRLHIASKSVGMRLPTLSTVSGHKYACF